MTTDVDLFASGGHFEKWTNLEINFLFLSPPANHNPPTGGGGGNVDSSEAKPPALFPIDSSQFYLDDLGPGLIYQFPKNGSFLS